MKRLSDYEPLLRPLMRLMAKETHFHAQPNLGEVLEKNDRLVVIFNHSTPLSWLPAACFLIANVCARGGGDRRPVAVMDRLFFEFPLVRSIARYFTQSERPLTFFELYEHINDLGFSDIVVFPEGSNCFFGHPEEIQDFRSPKFIELAIRVGAPVLVCVHRGSEAWARAVPVQESWMQHLDLLPKIAFDFLEKRLRQKGLFTLPLLPKAIERFEMHCELYHPRLSLADLSEDPIVRHAQIKAEAEQVRLRMQAVLRMLQRSQGLSQDQDAELTDLGETEASFEVAPSTLVNSRPGSMAGRERVGAVL